MTRAWRWTAPETVLALAVAGIVLGPYATVRLGFRDALIVQAVIVLVCAVAALGVGLSRREGWRNVVELPRPVLAGGALWAAAAVFGTVVAVARGNELRLVAGQLFAMGLLPVGIVAAGTLRPQARAGVFVRTLWVSILVAIGVHLAYPVYLAATGGAPLDSHRLYLPNAVSVAGVIVIALMLGAAVALERENGSRRITALVVAVFAGYVVGTGTRSLWAATVLGVAVFLVLEVVAGPRTRGVRMAMLVVVIVPVLAASGLAAAWHAPRHDVLPQPFPEPPLWVLPDGSRIEIDRVDGTLIVDVPPAEILDGGSVDERLSVGYPVDPTATLFFSADAWGVDSGTRLLVRFATVDGEPCHDAVLTVPAIGRWVRIARPVMRAPTSAPIVSVHLVRSSDGEPGPVRLRNLRLSADDPLMPTVVHEQLVFLAHRIVSTTNALRWGAASSLPSLRYRIVETRTLLDAFASAPWERRVLGHGLGARYALDVVGFSTTGVPMRFENPNYIHDFYVFLLYKLGLVGTVLVAAAVFCWLAAAWLRLRLSRRTVAAHEPIAVLAIWATYLAWGVLSPELIDFRVAPIVGMMVAATASIEQRVVVGREGGA